MKSEIVSAKMVCVTYFCSDSDFTHCSLIEDLQEKMSNELFGIFFKIGYGTVAKNNGSVFWLL